MSKEQEYPLSVIIPIHRADIDIARSIRSLTENNKLKLQIIVVANCDNISETNKINSLIEDLPFITLINVSKPGKANALNKALKYVEYDYVLIGDADTIFIPQGINTCMEKVINDDSIVAITGIVDPISTNLISKVQKFEYSRIFRVFKPFWSIFNANIILSGCATIFKKKSLFQIGLYDCKTLGEDFEITLKLHDYYISKRLPYKISYVNTVIAQTDVPNSVTALIKQRGRWFAGEIAVVRRYIRFLIHPLRYSRVVVPYLLAMVFDIFTTYFKWVIYAVEFYICIYKPMIFLKSIVFAWLGFVIFEILFNFCIKKRIGEKSFLKISLLSIMLVFVQFFLKDTNVISAFKLRRKENMW